MTEYKIDGSTKLRIVNDEMPLNPREEWDNLTTMICFHKRYNLGDKHEYRSTDYSGWNEVLAQIKKDYDIAIIKELRLYDHSGITISTSTSYPYNDRWDAGRVGFVFVTKKAIRECYGVKRITKKILERADKCLEGEVETYDQYLRGDVYGFELIRITVCDQGHEHEDIEDSCYGFFGYNIKENGILDYLSTEHRASIEAQL